ncbi:hypothetical protein OG558_22305 [Kribbella sp. NBC_01510]|uniref:hypothetical protein n=1 Tax=Kribbella sp. NBC_01510 TaxID=2903581 RepID=UPI00386B9014
MRAGLHPSPGRRQARLTDLAEQLEDVSQYGDTSRADALRTEHDALIHELTAAAGLGRRTRRLGDPTERARKTVSARILTPSPDSTAPTRSSPTTSAPPCGWAQPAPTARTPQPPGA